MKQTCTLLYDFSNSTGFVSSHDENILEAVQDHLHHLGVFHRQQVTERRDDVLLHQELHLHKPIHTPHSYFIPTQMHHYSLENINFNQTKTTTSLAGLL